MRNYILILIIVLLFITACAPLPLPTATSTAWIPLTTHTPTAWSGELTPTPTAWNAPSSTGTETVISGVPTLDPTLAALQLAVHPPEKRTGLADIDRIIDLVLAHDFQSLQQLTAYSQIGCTKADGMGGPPKCNSDEDEGTEVEVVPFLGPEGHHQRLTE